AGIEAGLGQPQEYAVAVEAPFVPDKGGQSRNDTPGEEDAGDPSARTDLVEEQVAGNFSQKVAEEKQTGSEAEHRIGEMQMTDHLRRGHADIRAIQISAEIAEHQQRHQSP